MTDPPEPPAGLRWWHGDDAPALTAAWADPTITRWNPVPDGIDAATWIGACTARRAAGVAYDLVIERDGAVAGEVGLRNITRDPDRAELGFWVGADHRRAGVGAGAVAAVAEWALTELDLTQVWARTDPANDAAAATLRRAGFDRLGERSGTVLWARH